MGKKSRLKKLRHELPTNAPLMWPVEDGIQALVPGQPPSGEELAAMTSAYQERIRKSPLWDLMVKEFGEQKAVEMLSEFKAKLE